MVPHLITALNGPLLELEKKILDATPSIERWFRLEWQEHTPPFYCSVDLRNAGFKLAPVDTNLFPGGFNNLAPEMLPLAVQAAMAAIEKALRESDLGVNPSNDGNVIRIILPQLTEERRRDYIKIARDKAEHARVSVRSIRRKAKEEIDRLVKDGDIGEDEGARGEKDLESLTKKHVDIVDALLKGKEAELLEV